MEVLNLREEKHLVSDEAVTIAQSERNPPFSLYQCPELGSFFPPIDQC
jgi:hypothetical protein